MRSRTELRPALALLVSLAAPAHGAGIEMTLTARDPAGGPARAGASVELAVDIRNAGSGYPLRGLHPSAWVRPRSGAEPTPRAVCVEAARSYSGKGGLPTGVKDLNGFTVVTIGTDDSLSVADPSVNLSTANLLLFAPLGARPRDLVIDDAGAAAYLTLPSALARVDLEDGRRTTLALDGGPGEILRDPLTGALWVALDAAGAVTRIGGSGVLSPDSGGRGDARPAQGSARRQGARTPVGSGPIRLAQDSEGGRVFAAAADGRITALDNLGPRVLWQVETETQPTAILYSALADSLYLAVAGPDDGDSRLLPFTADAGRAQAPIPLPGRADVLGLTKAGRMLLALDRETGRVSITDLARGRVLQALDFIQAPDALALTQDYAYVHHTAAPRVSLIGLKGLERARAAAVVDVPFGTQAPSAGRSEARPRAAADAREPWDEASEPLVAPLPHGGGAVVVNAPDRMAFVYMEGGMQAPMSAFPIKTGVPRRLALRDRKFQELGDGRYVTTAHVGGPGDYDLVVALAEPPVVNCLPLRIAGTPVAEAPQASAAPARVALVGEPTRDADLVVELMDASGRPLADVSDLQYLVMGPDGTWHRRGFARPDAGGRYRLEVRLPERGRFRVLLRSFSLGLRFEHTGGLYATIDD